MSFITLVCATHRPGNKTQKVVALYQDILDHMDIPHRTLKMEDMPDDLISSDSFGKRSSELERILDESIRPADHLIIISPEYNGSYPGFFKAFLDNIHPREFHGKKAALVGVASGRAGNLRGMDHLTDVLHHLKVEVYHDKVPISRLEDLLDQDGNLRDDATRQVLERQIKGFLVF